jgi:uncharacterized membrane protein
MVLLCWEPIPLWAAGGAALGQIRQWVLVNLALGLAVITVTLMRWAA